MSLSRSCFALALALTGAASPTPAAPAQQETPQQKAERMRWWTDARFGMFIHWGLYAVPAGAWGKRKDLGEWFMDSTMMPVSEYEKFAERFNPTRYDPQAWVRVAKDAGMRYLVITSKHHEGFAMWDTRATDYNIVRRTPYAKDVLKPLAEAARRQGLHFGTYYSIMDWHHPSQSPWKPRSRGRTVIDPAQKAAYVREMKAELRELVMDVGSELIWFDGEWQDWWTDADARDMYAYLRGLNPRLIINNRVANQRRGDMQGIGGPSIGDYGTPEQHIPASGFGAGVYWESCMTLNEHWGYNQYDQHWKPARTVVRNLVDIASKGGNYLLNVGPTAEGLIPQGSIERLAEVGQWMKVNGQAIYATQASPFAQAFAWGRVTAKPGRLYLHVFDWPAGGKLSLPIRNPVTRAYLLAAPSQALPVSRGDGGVQLGLPAKAPDAIASVIAVEIEGEVAPLP